MTQLTMALSRGPAAGSSTATGARTRAVVSLILLAEILLLAFALGRLGPDLLVVLLEGGQVLPGLGELALLHALADVPVHERALGVPESARSEGGFVGCGCGLGET